MDITAILIMGVAVAANIIIIKWKFEKDRTNDALLDAGLLIVLAFVFSGTISGLMVGTVASAVISLYLLISPPKSFNRAMFDKWMMK